MEKEEKKDNILSINEYKDKVHIILAHSYSVYLSFFLIGVFLDLIFNLKILNVTFVMPLGVILIVLASLLIFWAQKTSRNFKKETLTKETFSKGPYRFSRSPTHWGLFFLTLGFGLVINAVFIVIFSIFSFILTKLIYLKKEEKILEKKYGEPYREYKKSVRF
jgi:protein-S-isoprenylcysteine O-methyltransferase Ste14